MVLDGGFLGGAIDDLTGQPAETAKGGGTQDTFDKNRWTSRYGSNLADGEFTLLLEYEVEAQTEYNVGHGSAPVEETVGRWASVFYDSTAGAPVEGDIRVVTDNANGTDPDTLISSIQTGRLDRLNSDKRAKEAVPEKTGFRNVGEESKIKVLFRRSPDSTGKEVDWASGNTATEYDMTRWD